jgi:cation transport ATPase
MIWAFCRWHCSFALASWVMFALATPVQFYVGRQYYVGAYKALRNGSANMDVLVAMGTSAAYFYSLPITFGLLEGHVYYETAAVIITLIKLGKYLRSQSQRPHQRSHQEVDGAAGQIGAHRARRAGDGSAHR